MDMRRELAIAFFSDYKDKINENAGIEEFINSFKKSDLGRVFQIVAVIENTTSSLTRTFLSSSITKKVVAKEYIKDIKNIYKTILKNADKDILMQLDIFLNIYNNEKILAIHALDNPFSIAFIYFLRNFNLAKIKYLERKQILYIYTPIEIKNIIKELLNDKKIIKSSEENSKYLNNVHNILATYGVLPLEKLLEIYNKTYSKTDKKTLINKVLIDRYFNEILGIVWTYDESIFIYSMQVFDDEDDALTFYYSLPEELEYKEFTKKEYDMIGEGTYHKNIKEYHEIYDFLADEFYMSNSEISDFDELCILDYMFSYQINPEAARKNLNRALDKSFFLLDLKDKIFITSTILSIAKKYPSFSYKGFSLNEFNNMK